MSPKRKPRKYVNPVQAVMSAAKQTDVLRHEVYSFELLQQIAEHNQTVLIPALAGLLTWAVEIEREVRYLEAKRDEALAKRAKAGRK